MSYIPETRSAKRRHRSEFTAQADAHEIDRVEAANTKNASRVGNVIGMLSLFKRLVS